MSRLPSFQALRLLEPWSSTAGSGALDPQRAQQANYKFAKGLCLISGVITRYLHFTL